MQILFALPLRNEIFVWWKFTGFDCFLEQISMRVNGALSGPRDMTDKVLLNQSVTNFATKGFTRDLRIAITWKLYIDCRELRHGTWPYWKPSRSFLSRTFLNNNVTVKLGPEQIFNGMWQEHCERENEKIGIRIQRIDFCKTCNLCRHLAGFV